jgi:FkbM family methyltransferase
MTLPLFRPREDRARATTFRERAVSNPLARWLLPVRRSQTLRSLIRRGLADRVAVRPLAGTSYDVTFPAAHHLNLYFTRRIHYESELTRHLPSLVPEHGVAFDVGANIGIYTLLLAGCVKSGGRVFAFEPDPQNFPWLRRNAEQNGLDNVELVSAALGATADEMTLYQDPTTSRTSSLVAEAWHPDREACPVMRVRVEPLDAYVGRVSRADFVKIDAEGFECEVLKGGLEFLRRFKPTLLVEVHSKHWLELQSLVTPLGYRSFDPETLAPLDAGRRPSSVLCRPVVRGS